MIKSKIDIDLSKLRELAPTNSYSKLASILHCSKTTIVRYLTDLNIKPTKEQALSHRKNLYAEYNAHIDSLVKPYFGTMSIKDIAKITGLSKGQVSWCAYRNGYSSDLVLRGKFISKAMHERISSERRRMLFGLPRLKNMKLGYNPAIAVKRTRIRTSFRSLGYHVPLRSMIIYSNDSLYHPRKESNAIKLGFTILKEESV